VKEQGGRNDRARGTEEVVGKALSILQDILPTTTSVLFRCVALVNGSVNAYGRR